MNDNILEKVEIYLKENFKELYVTKREKFIGCKFERKNKYYIFYIFIVYENIYLCKRKNVNHYLIDRVNITNFTLENILNKVKDILQESIKNKPNNIIKSVRKTKKIKIINEELDKYKMLYEKLMLYELIISADVYQYFINYNIVSVIKFLYYDIEGDKCMPSLVKEKSFKLRSFLLSENKLFFLNNYQLLLKSRFKIYFTEEDYEKYIDFGMCVGNLTMNLISSLTDTRNVEIFNEYMNLSSKNNYTLRDLSKKYNVTHGRIRDIIDNILKKLKFYKGEYVILIQELDLSEILNYFIIGILGVYNKNFLKVILKILNLDIYDNLIFWAKVFRKYLISNYDIGINDERESKIYELIEFPLDFYRNDKKLFQSFTPSRSVDSFSSFSGKINLKKSKKTVEFESFTERKILSMFDNCNFVKEIKTQSVVIPFSSRGVICKYYPDIQILTNDNRIIIVEVKPLLHMMSKDSIFKYNLLKEYAFMYGFGYIFMDDRYHTFDKMLKRDVSNDIRDNFILYLREKRYLDYKGYREYIKTNNVNSIDIVNIVVNNQDKITFTSRPFKFRCREIKNENK